MSHPVDETSRTCAGCAGIDCHGARFAADGRWTGGQPTGNLRALQTTFDASAGTLTIG